MEFVRFVNNDEKQYFVNPVAVAFIEPTVTRYATHQEESARISFVNGESIVVDGTAESVSGKIRHSAA